MPLFSVELTEGSGPLTDLNAVSDEIGPVENGNIEEFTYYIVFSDGVSAGAVQCETAHIPGYTGTWAPEGSAITFGDDAVKTVAVTGVKKVRRVRVSTAIADGSVRVFGVGR